ncbi:hypothetical protein GQX73_g422 [Xylaria multiplex]|uniref:Uncharacterized protein n=1 Tax=Xylaria multiplex TaxID=323545 RepID=A0A7C8N194_9PEZI|nr:hypothetical protein GQX73_g422 [Xylaria multiplex]
MRSSKGIKYSSSGTSSSKRSQYTSAGYAPSTSYSSSGYTSSSGYDSYGGYGSSGYGSSGYGSSGYGSSGYGSYGGYGSAAGYSSTAGYGSATSYGSTADYGPSAGKSKSKEKSTLKEQGSGLQFLSIVIFANDSSESHNELHVGLQIEYRSQDAISSGYTFLHVIGGSGHFRREERLDFDATQSQTYISRVRVATIEVSGPADTRLRDTIYNTRVRNSEPGWYCQHYVDDALENCVRAGLITNRQADKAIDKMAETLVELTDH